MVILEVKQGSSVNSEAKKKESSSCENNGVERVNKHSDDAEVRFVLWVWPVQFITFPVNISYCPIWCLCSGWCPAMCGCTGCYTAARSLPQRQLLLRVSTSCWPTLTS